MKSIYDVLLAPVITEKCSMQRANGRYVFKVSSSSTKIDVKKAVEKIFNVSVKDVNTVCVKGKVRGAIRGRVGMTKSWKKAYVTLKAGQKIQTLEG
jgi:large subunit ribosomal protein L23